MLNHAVDALAALPNVTTYLDGTHSAWLGAGDIAHRLVAGRRRRRRRLLPQRLQLPVHRQQHALRPVDLELPDLRDRGRRRRLRRLPEPVLERRAAARQDRRAPRRVDRRRARRVRRVERRHRRSRPQHVRHQPALRQHAAAARADHAASSSTPAATGAGPWQPGVYPDPQDWCNPPDRGLGLATDARHR